MRPLKIFDVNMHHHWGGQPNRILTYNKLLARRGHEIVIAGPTGCLLCERAAAAGIETFDRLRLRRGFRPWSQWPDYVKLKKLFEQRRFDVVHTHGSQDTWLCVLAARCCRPPLAVVRTRHNTFPIAPHPFNRWLYRRIDRVITVSPQVDELLTRDGLFPAERIAAIYSAPDGERFHPNVDASRQRAEFQLDNGSLVIGMVGRYAPEKGYDDLIAAAALVIPNFPAVRFICVGQGRSETEMRAQIARLGLERNFILTGFREDVPELVALFDIFTLTPVSGESLGTSILEAFLEAKPVVATNVGGVCQSVRDGETGFLVEPRRPAELAARYLTLLRDAELRRRLGRRGRELTLAEFSAEALADKTEHLYYELLEAKLRSAPETPRP